MLKCSLADCGLLLKKRWRNLPAEPLRAVRDTEPPFTWAECSGEF